MMMMILKATHCYSLGSASRNDVRYLGGVEELHGELRAEILVAELGRVVFGHVPGRFGAILGGVQPEPLGLNTCNNHQQNSHFVNVVGPLDRILHRR